MQDNRYIRFPIASRPNPSDSYFANPILSAAPLIEELKLDKFLLSREIMPVLSNQRYRNDFPHDRGILIIGRDILLKCSSPISGVELEFFYQDCSDSIIMAGCGLILSGQAMGITIIQGKPELYKKKLTNPEEMTVGERMCNAHLEEVTKELLKLGNKQEGVYRNGWICCLNYMCRLIGIKFPQTTYLELDEEIVNASQIDQATSSHGNV